MSVRLLVVGVSQRGTPPSLSNVLRAQKLLDLYTRAFFSFYVFAFFALSINVISL